MVGLLDFLWFNDQWFTGGFPSNLGMTHHCVTWPRFTIDNEVHSSGKLKVLIRFSKASKMSSLETGDFRWFYLAFHGFLTRKTLNSVDSVDRRLILPFAPWIVQVRPHLKRTDLGWNRSEAKDSEDTYCTAFRSCGFGYFRLVLGYLFCAWGCFWLGLWAILNSLWLSRGLSSVTMSCRRSVLR